MTTFGTLHKMQQLLSDNDIIFCYSGYLNEDILVSFGNTIRQKLDLFDTDRQISRAIFAIFVEEAQNVIRYSKSVLPTGPDVDDADAIMRHGFLAIGREKDGRYFVFCGNLVRKEDAAKLREHLEHIQGLDASELKTLYKDTLKNDVPRGSKGAGVGFVDIARRAKGQFEFSFIDVDDGFSHFYLKAYA